MFGRIKKLEEKLKALELQAKQQSCTHHFRTFEAYKATSISTTIELFADCELCGLSIERDLTGKEVEEAFRVLITECMK
jgi:hypothetical protein